MFRHSGAFSLWTCFGFGQLFRLDFHWSLRHHLNRFLYLIAEQWSEMNSVASKLKQEELESLASWHWNNEDWMFFRTLLDRRVCFVRYRCHYNIFLFVIFKPNAFDLIGCFILKQVDFHNIFQFLEWQLASRFTFERFLRVQQLGVVARQGEKLHSNQNCLRYLAIRCCLFTVLFLSFSVDFSSSQHYPIDS